MTTRMCAFTAQSLHVEEAVQRAVQACNDWFVAKVLEDKRIDVESTCIATHKFSDLYVHIITLLYHET